MVTITENVLKDYIIFNSQFFNYISLVFTFEDDSVKNTIINKILKFLCSTYQKSDLMHNYIKYLSPFLTGRV